MKLKLFLATFVAIFAFLAVLPASVSAQTGERIVSFDVMASIQRDRTATITETIVYDFGTTQHHGIYRDIPTKYTRNGANYSLNITGVSVQEEQSYPNDSSSMVGSPVPFVIKSQSPIFRIQIGDANTLITGVHAYVISYQTDRAINFFKDGHAEFYWNVTGDQWAVPIERSSFRVTVPSSNDELKALYTPTQSDAICYTGASGSKEQACTSQVTSGGENIFLFATKRALGAGEGWTTDISFPKGVITPQSFAGSLAQFLRDNGIFGLPILAAIIMFFVWWFFGKDPKGRGTVVPQYEAPRGLTPMEMYGLVHQSANHIGVTATIIDIARRGYLKIIYVEKKKLIGSATSYEFEKGKDQDSVLLQHEKWLLDGLFGGTAKRVTLDSLKKTFYTFVKNANDAAIVSLRTKGFMASDPIKTRSVYGSIAAAFVFFGFYIRGTSWPEVVSFIATGIIIFAFGWFMSKVTKEGAIALEEVEGFKWFLSVTEKDRLAFTDAPKLKPEAFHQFLPYAIVLGVEKQWAGQFASMDVPPPSYVDGYGSWNTIIFISMLHSFDTQAQSSAYTPPNQGAGSGSSGFGGGGFSGGGFGGGGGGSW